MNPYVPVLVMLGVASALAVAGVVASRFIGPRRRNDSKLSPYECGLEATPGAAGGGRIPIRYYLLAMTFIVFDVEIVLLYPWAIAYGRLSLFGFVAALSFVALITVPFAYEWRRGGFDW
jgi:NADH-quinone oxidoreductase subunit A